ncbi:MAG TPA: fatty acid--CoA ligase [Acidimicrobiales bacterium]|nr:fatty acid--CoA ligase [Acidimicrobiales bacterium]
MSEDTRPSIIAGCLRHWAAHRPGHPALRWDGGQMTYAELDERSNRAARGLADLGVGRGDRVAYLDKNSPEQLELFVAAAKIGAVPCPVNYRLAPPEVAFIVSDSEAKVFVVGEEFVPVLRKIQPDLPGVQGIVIGSGEGERGGPGAGDGDGGWPVFAAWRDARDPVDPGFEAAPEDIACQLYSSGTTGRPKGVQLTQANLSDGRDLYRQIMGLGPDAVSVVPMPLYHIGGTGWAMAGFWQGATNVLVREIVPPRLLETMLAERVTHGFIVPAVLQFMLAVPDVEKQDWSTLEAILYGASPISETVLAAAIRTFGCRFVQAYGLTESTGTVLYLPAADHDPDGPARHRLRSCGIPIPGVEVKIVDPTTAAEQPAGEVGEIWVKGPTVMAGYWHLPEQTADTVRADGWLRTGDAGYRDEDGYFYIHDRVKDMIVSGGENVYPAEVENVVMSHPDVADVAVIGIPDDKWGETPRAMVVRRPGSELAEADLIAFCRERLAGFKCPTSVGWLDELPRNPSGKVLKKDLRAPFWEGLNRMVG